MSQRANDTESKYRVLGEEFRSKAGRARNANLAHGYWQLAKNYERLARHAERPKMPLDLRDPAGAKGPNT
jgi:hypothetical protein